MSGLEEVRLEVHKVKQGYVQQEREIIVFTGQKLYEGTDFLGPCTVYQKKDGRLLFYYQSWDKMIYTEYDNISEASRVRNSRGYYVHDRSAIRGAAEALDAEIEPEERHI